jgi:hypothetical protein
VSNRTSTSAAKATAEWHVDTIVNGLRGVVETRLKFEQDQRVQRQLFLILRKLSPFCSPDHFEKKLALHTASYLLNLCSNYGSVAGSGQHEQIMHVSIHTECKTDHIHFVLRRIFCAEGCSKSCGSPLVRGV